MIVKKILLSAASIIKLFIFLNFFFNFNAFADNNKYYSSDYGILSIMYHRFNEDKYPSTNISMKIFKKQIELIKKEKIDFIDPKNFGINFNLKKSKKKILLTIDDAFSSFYEHAWPYLKKERIPFILFVSTQSIGKYGYMNWNQIKEIEKEEFVIIGNHSHSHEYLVEYEFNDFKNDIDKSIKIFRENIGYNPVYFSYPFGEYSLEQKKYISNNFDFAFGQNSGVIDLNKDRYELPRFPINEKYGNLERFSFIINLHPLEYKNIIPDDKYVLQNNNPPKTVIEFFEEQKNLEKINCFSDEGSGWDKSKIKLIKNKLYFEFSEKFTFRRGRINCSLNDEIGWRWLGLQFSIKQN
jgi:peptidoglycan/xylan/chitin deacetylase (PgdA/CDA1 family)